jgi:molybdate transport system regulatory protein
LPIQAAPEYHLERDGRHARAIPRLAVHHKVWLDAGRRFALGDGGVVLLRAIDAGGSIRSAAARAGWSYRHTLAYLDNAERSLGFRLVVRSRGGSERGGTTLTPRARDFVRRYDRFRRRLDHALRDFYDAAFG